MPGGLFYGCPGGGPLIPPGGGPLIPPGGIPPGGPAIPGGAPPGPGGPTGLPPCIALYLLSIASPLSIASSSSSPTVFAEILKIIIKQSFYLLRISLKNF